jgi:putative oxidoreductase
MFNDDNDSQRREFTVDKVLNIAARILMSQIFIISGLGKISGYAGTQAYMAKMGVPGMLLPLVILTELGGGLALLAGFQTRWVALALAGFCVVSALIFHLNFSDQMQMINFMKNMAMAGGLLMFVRFGNAASSIDRRGNV